VEQSEWTEEDRALMIARQQYKASLCPNCGMPKAIAWHAHNEGWVEVTEVYTCHGCTAIDNYDVEDPSKRKPREYPIPTYTRPPGDELAPFPRGRNPRDKGGDVEW